MTATLPRERFIGCLVGLALGDALGAPLEFMTRQEVAAVHGEVRDLLGGGWLNVEPGEWTDDTQMAVALANSILSCRGVNPRDIARRFVEWAATHPKDIGNATRLALRYHAEGLHWAAVGPRVCHELAGRCAGNGSVMRCAPVGLLHALRPEALIHDSLRTSALTHVHPEAAWSTVAVNLALAELLAGRRDGLIERVAALVEQEAVRATLLAAPSWPRAVVKSGGYVLDTLGAAFWALMNHAGFEEVVVAAINLGGDADTVGAVAGALAGAREGINAIPARWLRQLHGAELLADLAAGLYRLAQQPLAPWQPAPARRPDGLEAAGGR